MEESNESTFTCLDQTHFEKAANKGLRILTSTDLSYRLYILKQSGIDITQGNCMLPLNHAEIRAFPKPFSDYIFLLHHFLLRGHAKTAYSQ
jgi:hypothetical protein